MLSCFKAVRQLTEDGRNLPTWLFQIKNIFEANDLDKAFIIKIIDPTHHPSAPVQGGDDDLKLRPINTLENQDIKHFPAIKDLSTDAANKYGLNTKTAAKSRQMAFTAITMTVAVGHISIIQELGKHPAVIMAYLRDTFNPVDKIAIQDLYDKMHGFHLSRYGDDFVKLAVDIRRTYNRLHQLGELVSDNFCMNTLLNALPDNSFQLVKTLIRRDRNKMTYRHIVSEVNKHLRETKKSRMEPNI